MATHSSNLGNPLQEIPWTEEPGSPWGHKELDSTKRLSIHACIGALGLTGCGITSGPSCIVML